MTKAVSYPHLTKQFNPLVNLVKEGTTLALKRAHNPTNIIQQYVEWQNKPVEFCQKFFGVDFTASVAELMRGVVNHNIIIGKSANGIGKTYCAAHLALWYFRCHPNAKVFVTAPSPERNINNLWNTMMDVVYKNNTTVFSDISITKTRIWHKQSTTWSIEKVTIPNSQNEHDQVARFSGKHAEYMLFILDEADGIPDPIFTAIEGCTSYHKNRVFALFNPHEKKGRLYHYELLSYEETNQKIRPIKIVNLSALEHPNVKERKDIINGAVSYKTTLSRVMEYTDPLPETMNLNPETDVELPLYFKDDVPLLRRRIKDQRFYYMVLGRYPVQSESQLILQDDVDRAIRNWELYTRKHGENNPPAIAPKLGCDIASDGTTADDTVVAIRYGNYVAPLISWNRQSIQDTVIKIAAKYREVKASIAYVDATGVGAGVSGFLRDKHCEALSVMVAARPTIAADDLAQFTHLRDQLYWELRNFLSQPDAMIPPDERLRQELLILRYEVKDGKIKVMTKDKMKAALGGRSPDAIDALALTFYRNTVDNQLDFYRHTLTGQMTGPSTIEVDYGDETFSLAIPEATKEKTEDFAAVSYDETGAYWTWFRGVMVKDQRVSGNILVITEAHRFTERNTEEMVRSLMEANQRRRFSTIHLWKDDASKSYKQLLNQSISNCYNPESYQSIWPGFSSLKPPKGLDRKEKQTINLKNALQSCTVIILKEVAEQPQIWRQMADCESKPDDARDALILLLSLTARK